MKYSGILIILLGVFFVYFFVNENDSSPVLQNNPAQNNKPGNQNNVISSGAKPDIPFNLPNGFVIHVFAKGLENPRDLQFTEGGTLLVSNPQVNKIIALPDKNNDGVADEKKSVIQEGNHIHGLAFYNGKLFVAEADKVVRYIWDEKNLTATKDKILFSLPQNNNHNNRTLSFNNNGQMFVSIGSTCNVCIESPNKGGSVWISDENGNNPGVFATGLRNAPFSVINPKTNELWATEMGRDFLGDNTPPDEINIIKESLDYGWPNCYGDKIHDNNFDKRNNSCQNTKSPIFQIPAHSAPLGLTFINSAQFPADWQGDLLVSYHGSWNRSTPSGYKVVHMKVNGNSILRADDFITGFIQGNTNDSALARPVDLTFDKNGNLYLSDDKAGNIFIIQKNN